MLFLPISRDEPLDSLSSVLHGYLRDSVLLIAILDPTRLSFFSQRY